MGFNTSQWNNEEEDDANPGTGLVLRSSDSNVTVNYSKINSMSIILNDANEIEEDKTLTIEKIDPRSRAITVLAPSGNSMDGAKKVVLPRQWSNLTLKSDGISNYEVISRKG